MSMARVVIAAVVVEGRSKSEVAREYGVSRRWVIKLVQRLMAEGDRVVPGSRRPKRTGSAAYGRGGRDRRAPQGVDRYRP